MEGNQKTRIQKFMGGNKKGYQTAFHMAWPAVMESFFIALAGMVDSLMVSSMGPEAVAAVGLTTQPKFIGLCIFIATNVSVSALVARRRGEKDQYGANQVLLMAAAFTLAVGTLISMACVFFADPIIRLCGANEDTQAGAVRYFQIIMGGMMFNIISMAINAAQRGAGNTKIAMRTNVTSNVVNMIGNYLLIQGNLGFPRLGITGAALATVAAQAASVLLSLAVIRRRTLPFTIGKKNLRFERRLVGRILALGTPIALQDLLVSISFLVILAIVNSMGVIASAGVGVAEKLCAFIMLVASAYMQSMSAFVAQNMGAGKPERAKRALLYGIGTSLMAGMTLFYFSFFHGDAMAGIFARDPQVVAAAADYLKAYAIDCILTSFLFCFVGYFNGCGKTFFVMVQGIVGAFCVRIPVSWFMSRMAGVTLFKIGLATPCSSAVQILLCAAYFIWLSGRSRKHRTSA